MDSSDVGALVLFTTRPTDRALEGWMPHEVATIEVMTDAQVDRYVSSDEE